jgi:hypothetical protein
MANNKDSRLSPAEDYLNQLNPDQPFRGRQYLLYRSKSEVDSHYRPIHGKNVFNEKLDRSLGIISFALIPLGALALLVFAISQKSLLLFIILGFVLFLILVLVLAVRDGSRPAKKDVDDDDTEER